MGLLPTAGVTIAWCGFANGNVIASVKMVVIGLTLGGLLTPIYINFLMGEVVSVPFLLIFKKIGCIIFLPMALAILTRAALIKRYGMEYFQQQIKPNFAQIAAIGPLTIVFIGLSLRAHYIVDNPQLILWILIPLSLFYLINYTLSTILAKLLFNREDGMALIFSSAMRHLAISLAVAFTVFEDKGADIALMITVAFILQPQFAAWYIKISNKIFPSSSPVEATAG
jgi:ACR3 family arsenite efflux pump ArsB